VAPGVRDWDDFVTFYDFPTEHWLHLRNWRALNGGPNLMQLVLAGAVFKDGRLQQWPGQAQQKELTAA
jgi:hypothetical protein